MSKHKPDGRKSSHHKRALHSYDRRPGNRIPGQCILIVCEGAETEPNYFESLRRYLKLSTIRVAIIDRAGAPIGVIEEAQAQAKKRKRGIRNNPTNTPQIEAIWCVFDVENPHYNQTFDRAVQIADQNGFRLAISNPAFEFWYVLHFEHTTRPFSDGNDIKKYLERHLPGYHPAMSVFDALISSTQIAVRNAKQILENHPQSDCRFPNPSTLVHLLVEKMIEMSPSGREHLK